MIYKKIVLMLVCFSTLNACADYKGKYETNKKEKKYFSSTGFALIYENELYEQKIVNKKMDNDSIMVMHSTLKKNTPVKILNPSNSLFVKAKISKRANYPKIFSVVLTKEIASTLKLDLQNPFVEIIETKKNKTFIAKKSNTFDEEKNVAETLPVNEVQIDIISNADSSSEVDVIEKSSFILIVSDFYYKDSANNLMIDLIKKTKMNNISIKKINDKKYRLFVGPFENFNALKTSYISLNKLGFENLNIYKQ
jgi:hypothetical protein